MTRHAHPYSQEWLRAKKFIGRFPSLLVIFLTLWTPLLVVQEQTDANPRKPDSGFIDYLLNYLNMAGTKKSNEFRPMTQPERNRRHCSISQVGGVAAGAFLARVWLPPSQSSAGAGAVSLGITMGSNAAFGIGEGIPPRSWPRLGKEAQEAGNRLG